MATTDTERQTIHTVPCNILLFAGNICSNPGFRKIHNATEPASFGYSLGVWHCLCPAARAMFANYRGRRYIQTPPAFVRPSLHLGRGVDPRSGRSLRSGLIDFLAKATIHAQHCQARAAFTSLDPYAGRGQKRVGVSAGELCRRSPCCPYMIGPAHVSVNINGGCTDSCGNIARAWQSLHVLRLTGRDSDGSPQSRQVSHRVPGGVVRVQGRGAM